MPKPLEKILGIQYRFYNIVKWKIYKLFSRGFAHHSAIENWRWFKIFSVISVFFGDSLISTLNFREVLLDT